MPRGKPKAGFRMTKKRLSSSRLTKNLNVVKIAVKQESEAEIAERLSERFNSQCAMVNATVSGKNRAMIISGPPGVGKSYNVGQILGDAKHVYSTVIKGYVRPTGLYKTLYEFRHPNSVVVFDDADSIFNDDVSLNLLKAACDTTKKRMLHWLTETKMEDEEGERMPRNFEFEGSIIFITNYDFDDMIERGSKLAPHFEALVSRSHYLDLGMKTAEDYIVRIKQVVREHGMLRSQGFTAQQENDVLDYIQENKTRLRELSLRMVLKLANLVETNPNNWKNLARATCLKGV